MQEYLNQPCIVCGETFGEQDDIVTCPECGTPYHRECWKKSGKCVNTALHEQGASWILERKAAEKAAREAERAAEEAEQAAERERGSGPELINGELYDGVRLRPEDPCIGLNPEEQLDGVTIGEAAAFVRTNRFYYLPLFRLMKRTGKKMSFNLLSLFAPHFYFANRKMWGYAMLALLVNTVLEIPAVIMVLDETLGISLPWADVNTTAFHRVYTVSLALYVLCSVIWSLCGNYLYYRFTVRRINGIKKTSATPEEAKRKMQQAGGTSLLNVLLILGMQFVITRSMGFLLAIIR